MSVVAPTIKSINVSCNLSFSPDNDRDVIVCQIEEKLNSYFRNTNEIKKSYVGSLILAVDGVDDYSNLALNASTANIAIRQDEYPVLGMFTTDATEVV